MANILDDARQIVAGKWDSLTARASSVSEDVRAQASRLSQEAGAKSQGQVPAFLSSVLNGAPRPGSSPVTPGSPRSVPPWALLLGAVVLAWLLSKLLD